MVRFPRRLLNKILKITNSMHREESLYRHVRITPEYIFCRTCSYVTCKIKHDLWKDVEYLCNNIYLDPTNKKFIEILFYKPPFNQLPFGVHSYLVTVDLRNIANRSDKHECPHTKTKVLMELCSDSFSVGCNVLINYVSDKRATDLLFYETISKETIRTVYELDSKKFSKLIQDQSHLTCEVSYRNNYCKIVTKKGQMRLGNFPNDTTDPDTHHTFPHRTTVRLPARNLFKATHLTLFRDDTLMLHNEAEQCYIKLGDK